MSQKESRDLEMRSAESRSLESRATDARELEERHANARKMLQMNFYDTMAAPIPPEGMVYYWVREKLRGVPDDSRFNEMYLRGWTPVPASRHPEMCFRNHYGKEASGEGVIRFKEAILCERPVDLHDLEMKQAADRSWVQDNSLMGLEGFQGMKGAHLDYARQTGRPTMYQPSEEARRQATFAKTSEK